MIADYLSELVYFHVLFTQSQNIIHTSYKELESNSLLQIIQQTFADQFYVKK